MVRRERGRLRLVIKVRRRKKVEAVLIDLEILMSMFETQILPEGIYLRHKNYTKRLKNGS